MNIKKKFTILTCFLALTSQGQIDTRFSDKSSYFEYIDRKYAIDSTKIYYTLDATKKTIFYFPAFTYFIRKDKIITIDEVANELESYCPPKKLFGQLSYELVSNLLEQQNYEVDLILKNLHSNDILDQNDEIVAVFLFSVDYKKLGVRYIKHKKKLENLGFKTIILSMDMPSIHGVTDYSKINQLRVKKN
ncbi:hypothetical protein ESY86_11370 [Subsaximicrobium wynnwilliamsii]|uniref:Uncharacterized protein n=1 Tax=Subsaximicrobium wynnwilliamsii TaxID=291179 RepID=A0A5C6ZJL3_9FLAO|nr:hypothetical protein [Subsaximicrobium wynnwilliamsii]TXD83086.1 hypothetical protein ESY87_11405 [Subsaximicrobium wynnwilliamsii]TXD88830.1 hypothetical protein ESY86_11370 [Subsaximicrobium wynnwilliamsii]TXE02903.1 hypothetical protein ESY88_10425 [Subsaximicrobium wynnwilliamsii]